MPARRGGGRYRGTIAQQLVHLAEALRAGCQWYDLEIETASRCPPELLDVLLGEGRQLASAHFFETSPRESRRSVAADLRSEPAGCHQDRGALRFAWREAAVARVCSRDRRNIVAVPMGEVAMPCRFSGFARRKRAQYAPVENATAPGQVSLDEMKTLYRADKIDRRTRVYGVIGDPDRPFAFAALCRMPAFRRAG